jgi:hypothetical protein
MHPQTQIFFVGHIMNLFAFLIVFYSWVVQEAQACDVKLMNGNIVLSEELPLTPILPENTKICLRNLGERLQQIKGLRSVTVAIRTAPSKRSQAFAVAKAYISELENNQIPKQRLSFVFPPIKDSEKIEISYAARSNGISIAVISSMQGTAFSGEDTPTVPVATGQKLTIGSHIKTSENSNVYIVLADGSKLRLYENSYIQLQTVRMNEEGKKEIDICLFAGNVETAVKSTDGGSFQVRTQGSSAGVRGTKFRISQLEKATRLETYEGEVLFSNEKGSVSVPIGYSSEIQPEEPPSELISIPKTPRVVSPKYGTHKSEMTLKWKAEKDLTYILEMARDAEFSIEYQKIETTKPQLPVAFSDGIWFWHVAAVHPSGMRSNWSKIFSFTVENED